MGHHLKPEEPLHETVTVLSYEVGRLLEQSMYLKWGEEYGKEEKILLARKGIFKSELMDVAAQVRLVCESVGVTVEEMVELGLEKAADRFSGKERKFFLEEG